MMHLALFLGSFEVLRVNQKFDLTPYNTIANNYTAFILLRWAHLVMWIIALLTYWLNQPGKLEDTPDKTSDDVENNNQQSVFNLTVNGKTHIPEPSLGASESVVDVRRAEQE